MCVHVLFSLKRVLYLQPKVVQFEFFPFLSQKPLLMGQGGPTQKIIVFLKLSSSLILLFGKNLEAVFL